MRSTCRDHPPRKGAGYRGGGRAYCSILHTPRYLDAEQAVLIAACPFKLRCLVMLLLLTGARVGETLALRWEDVSDEGVLTFLHTKTGKIRCVGGTDEIQAVLKRCHAHERTFSRVHARGRPTRLTVCDRCCGGP